MEKNGIHFQIVCCRNAYIDNLSLILNANILIINRLVLRKNLAIFTCLPFGLLVLIECKSKEYRNNKVNGRLKINRKKDVIGAKCKFFSSSICLALALQIMNLLQRIDFKKYIKQKVLNQWSKSRRQLQTHTNTWREIKILSCLSVDLVKLVLAWLLKNCTITMSVPAPYWM